MTGSPRTRPCARSTTGLALRAFIAAVLGVDTLHPYAGPLGSLNINVLAPGRQLGWHFDNADFVTTLMLRPAEAGGLYEYVPGLRRPEDETTDALARACARSIWRRAPSVVFRGRTALHRVTPVEGAHPRLLAVLSYHPEPGRMLTGHTRKIFYGRVG